MFANRYTAFIDACTLASALKRNLLLSLAEAGFFRVRWSVAVLDEAEAAIAKMLTARGYEDGEHQAARARAAMSRAFEEAEARSAGAFIADTIALDAGKAVVAIRTMRQRFSRPEITAERLLVDMEAAGLTETADALREYVGSL